MTTANVRTAIHERVDACRAGLEPTLVARLASGWVVMGDPQVFRGYCLLLPDPVVPDLNAMPPAGQAAFLADMALVGQAVLELTAALRINYAIFGNVEPALHAHVLPRFADEEPALRTTHPWGYDWGKARRFDPAVDGALHQALSARLTAAMEPKRGSLAEGAPGCVHHLDLSVTNRARSTPYYDAVLTRMGYHRVADADEGPLWRGEGQELGLQESDERGRAMPHYRFAPGLHHLALRAPSRAAVDWLHGELVQLGIKVLDAPAQYDRYSPGYYAVFFADPDGLKLEYVYTP
jgi:diadenosine tetraphosphate (Ap4A) HIT family hydrolase/catechol 2,3-dioxygenase-like lactoylglutathione lyase family enzyme